MADDKKIKITPKEPLASSKAMQLSKEFEATRKSFLDSQSIRAIEESSRLFQASMVPHLREFTAASAALDFNSEIFRTMRLAEETMAGYGRLFSTAKSIALDFPAMNMAAKQYAELYRNPLQGEIDKFIASTTSSAAALHKIQSDFVKEASKAIHSPWIKAQDAFASIQGLVGLSSIGKILQEATHPFEKDATHIFRDQLGDWRRAIPTESMIEDPLQRSAYYLKQGLNPLLTDYPTRAFDDALNATHLRSKQPKPAIPTYQLPSETGPDIDEPPAHMIEAYKVIYSFESRMRRFIDKIMSEKFGPNWVKHRVPGDMKRTWEEKRTKALDSGEQERNLICYADFTHYEIIIVKNDNWNDVFMDVFRNKESVAESLRRLYPMRISTMHSRIIISEDMLFIFAETRRLLKAMDNYFSNM